MQAWPGRKQTDAMRSSPRSSPPPLLRLLLAINAAASLPLSTAASRVQASSTSQLASTAGVTRPTAITARGGHSDHRRAASTRGGLLGRHDRRRAVLSQAAGALGLAASAPPASAALTKESEWPLWLALPVAPYSRRKTIRREVGPGVWAFDQLIGIYYVHVPIRMTVVKMESGGTSTRPALAAAAVASTFTSRAPPPRRFAGLCARRADKGVPLAAPASDRRARSGQDDHSAFGRRRAQGLAVRHSQSRGAPVLGCGDARWRTLPRRR